MGTPNNHLRSAANVRLDMETDPQYRPTARDLVATGQDCKIAQAIATLDIAPFLKEITTAELINCAESVNREEWQKSLLSNHLHRDLTHERVVSIATVSAYYSALHDKSKSNIFLSRKGTWLMHVWLSKARGGTTTWHEYAHVVELIDAAERVYASTDYKSIYYGETGRSNSLSGAIIHGLHEALRNVARTREYRLREINDSLQVVRRRAKVILGEHVVGKDS